MIDPIRIVHFSDFHMAADTRGPLDAETGLNGRILDYLDVFDSLIEYAEDHDADLALFAGDAYHRHSPTPTYMREFSERIIRLSDQCPIVLLPGNHDMPGAIEKASSIDIFDTIRTDRIIVGMDYEVLGIDTPRGYIQVATVPYPLKQLFLTSKQLRSSPERTMIALQRAVAHTIQELAEEVDPNYPAILLGHFAVSDAVYGAERAMIIGMDAEVHLDDLASDVWDYVALGHIHYYQDITKGMPTFPPVVYSGSMERVDFSEENQDKGFVWVEIGEEVNYEFVQLDARPFITIEVNAIGSNRPTRKVIKAIRARGDDLTDSVVRLIIHVDEDRRHAIHTKKIYDELEDIGVYIIHGMDIREKRNTRDIRLDKPAASLTNVELLSAYFESECVDNSDELLSLARAIMAEVEDE